MTAKEKALRLVSEYRSAIKFSKEYGNPFDIEERFMTKQFALIAVDEILEICSLDCLTNLHNHEFEAKFNYWQEVKKEIEKL